MEEENKELEVITEEQLEEIAECITEEVDDMGTGDENEQE